MKMKSRIFGLIALGVATLLPLSPAQAAMDIAQTPLYLGGSSIPANLIFTLSVEWPTIIDVANLDTTYTPSTTYTGYFDSGKCYDYSYSSTESMWYFNPVSKTSNHTCSGHWSGNFLNWATTHTIDPFRKALTGGYRVVDTPTTTWLEQAWDTGQGSASGEYPNRSLTNSTDIAGATPFSWSTLYVRSHGAGNQLWFTENGNVSTATKSSVVAYDPSATSMSASSVYYASVRVAVCDASVGLEPDCVPYSQGYKPEGLIQKYSNKVRYGVFGYLNDSSTNPQRDGGVLRAKAQFVGPTLPDGSTNTNAEWDATTGVLIQNPDPADATATTNVVGQTIDHSGVINYINDFGEMTQQNDKSYDPVSELYYAAIRYLEHIGNVSAYSNMSGTSSQKYNMADGFPVITSWDDPITNWCQSNIILGIGDENTWNDKDLPGTESMAGQEPSTQPTEVSSDTKVNVKTWLDYIRTMEGATIATPLPNHSGLSDSAYIAALAYYAHTSDLRSDLTGVTTASTYWVDVAEGQKVQPADENQFYLATKYGGFSVPSNYDPTTNTTPLTTSWWHTNSDIITAADGSTFKRPDNYYLAANATEMVDSLSQAFTNIITSHVSSASSVVANSTHLDSSTYVYQARFDSSDWSGDLLAYALDPNTGAVASVPSWKASANIPTWSSRNVFTIVGSTGKAFTWSNLSSTQQTELGSQDVLNYILGDQSLEAQSQKGGTYRNRSNLLGDIINSDPWFVGQENFGYNSLPGNSGNEGSSYPTFLASTASRTPMIYVGANDGMLHAFDANTGIEKFAYIPNEVIPNLPLLTDPNYIHNHHYYVDGSPKAAPAYVAIPSAASPAWHTVLVDTTGAGGGAVFALDVTDPDNFGASDVLWEDTSATTGLSDLGTDIGQASIVRLANGDWGAIFGNGYNSASGHAILYIVNVADGSLIAALDAGTGSCSNPNGLASPLVIDSSGDHIADTVYAGDMCGDMWKFDISNSNASKWAIAYSSGNGANAGPAPLFIARGPNKEIQPITAKPQAGYVNGNMMVFFGTGAYFRTGDNIVPSSPDVESLYGIIDGGAAISKTDRSTLVGQTILAQVSTTISSTNYDLRIVSSNKPSASQTDGWYLDLLKPDGSGGTVAEGERSVSTPLLWSDRVIFTTLIPSADACDFGGTSWLMELDPATGGQLSFSPFDLNKDGVFTSGDYVTVTLPDGSTVTVPVSGVQSTEGIIKTPAVVSAGDTAYKYTSGSSGKIQVTANKGLGTTGRQSWQQLQ